LCRDGTGDFRSTVADGDVPQRRQTVEILASVGVPDMDASALHQLERAVLLDQRRRGKATDQIAPGAPPPPRARRTARARRHQLPGVAVAAGDTVRPS